MLPNSPSSLLNLMASTSTQVDVFSDGVIQSVKNGETSPLHVMIQLKAMELATERIKKEIKDNVLTAAEKYPGKEFEFLGNKIVKGDVHTEYDFSPCGDPVWETRKSIFEAAKTSMQEREAFLKTIKQPVTIVDEGSGEIVTLKPAIKKTVPGIKISIR